MQGIYYFYYCFVIDGFICVEEDGGIFFVGGQVIQGVNYICFGNWVVVEEYVFICFY